jgi:uncharacterized membrane protein YhdT
MQLIISFSQKIFSYTMHLFDHSYANYEYNFLHKYCWSFLTLNLYSAKKTPGYSFRWFVSEYFTYFLTGRITTHRRWITFEVFANPVVLVIVTYIGVKLCLIDFEKKNKLIISTNLRHSWLSKKWKYNVQK